MRHPAQGPRQRGHRLRAVGGVSVQSRHALPEGREALPAGLASRSPAHGAAARPVGCRRLQRDAVSAGHRARRRPRSAGIQQTHGAGAVGVLGGASLTTEKTYLLGQVRARLPEDAVHRLQRPAVHGQRRRRQQEGVRHRSHHQPVVRHGRHRGHLGRRLERRRVLADHDQLHLAGARAGREDHRPGSAHHADRPHLRPLPAGQAGPRRRAVRRRAAAHDRARLARSRVHRAAHGRLRAGRRVLPAVDAGPDGRGHRRAAAGDQAGRRDVGTARRPASSSTRAASSTTRTACRTRSARSTSCSPPAASAGRRAATARSSARPTARAAASTDRSATSCPGWRDISNPEHRRYIAGVWGIDEQEIPGPGVDAYEMFRKIDTRRDQGPAGDLLQPEGVAARQRVRHALPRQARVLRRDRLLPERDGAARRHRPARQPAGGGRGHGDAGRRTGHQDQQGVSTARARRARTGASSRTSRRRSAGRTASPSPIRARSSRSCASPARAASPTTRASPTRRSTRRWACSGRATARIRRPARAIARPSRARRVCSSRAATTRSPKARGRSTFRTAARASTSPTTGRRSTTRVEEYPIFLTTGRVVSQFLSGTQTRRIGPLVEQYPEPRLETASAAGRQARDRRRRLGDGRDAARRPSRCRRRSSRRSAPTRLHPVPLAGPEERNQLTVAAQDPISKIPQYKVCGCRVRKADGRPDYADALEPQQ